MVFGPFVCQKLMASYHEIASRSCDTYVGEFSCSRSGDRPPPLLCVISGFRVSNSGTFFFTYFCDFYWYDLSIFVHRWIRVSLTGFLEMISRICASPIFVISIDKFYQYLCIGEFVCHWLLWLTLILSSIFMVWWTKLGVWRSFDSCVDFVTLNNPLMIFN